jgi:transcription elongation GreA/GreB family factor/very-short-patch-repair endonuclease
VNGTYSDHTNEKEADAVLSILENNIHRLPNGKYPGVGIATFNIAQRNLIKSRLLERRKFEKYKEFNDKILELEEEGMFVKNLENIQGDERDVVILSTTYGINQDGKFNQRFGPINHQKGYKLLNVIITRAKYKIYLCTSIPEKVYLGYKDYLITEGENNRRAVFFAYLSYTKAVSENNHEARKAILNDLAENSNIEKNNFSFNADLESPFEEEVYEALISTFEEKKIIPQVQFAGFRIDLVYDPQHPGLPKIAIECDGAAYHSSREAYLYDRHRQKILENHGFVFHRIWSTNWWRNPKREANQLIEFIKSIENRNPELFESSNDASQAFTDNVQIIRNELPYNDPEVQQDLLEELDQIESHSLEIFPEADKGEKIKSFSKVKVNYLNNNKEIMVELVESGAVHPVTTNGVMKINIKTPLGQALVGKRSGETVKIGKLDNYVEILEVVN